MKTKQLDKSFTKRGNKYNQLRKSEKAFLYEVVTTRPDGLYFEVFRHKTANQYDFETKTRLDDRYEVYPSNEDFGKTAWCISRGDDFTAAFERANEVFNQLNQTS